MTHRETKFLEIFLIVLFISIGALFAIREINHDIRDLLFSKTESGIVKHKPQQAASADVSQWKEYQSTSTGISLKYPQTISVTQSATSGLITLNHNIPFSNHGDCDMKGDEQAYSTLNDFNVTVQIKKGTVAQVVKKLSPYIPAENFSGNTLKASPGFIDPVTIGSYSGFSIYEGAEGCGWTIYYFPLDDGRVLVVKKDMVQMLSSVVIADVRNQVLKVPGVITSEHSDAIFKQIVGSLKIEDGTVGWKTYTNDTYGFELSFPPHWNAMKVESNELYFDLPRVTTGKYEFVAGINTYTTEEWNKVQNSDGYNPNSFIAEKDGIVFTSYYGQDDTGYIGFEDYNQKVASDGYGGGKIGPYKEFDTLVIPTFKFTK